MQDENEYFTQLRANIEKARAIVEANVDPELVELAKAEIAECEAILNPSLNADNDAGGLDENFSGNVIVEIRPAAGGDEAALFAGELFRMYTAFATANKFKIELIDKSETEIGGIKEVSFFVSGKQNTDGRTPYDLFRFESGVHRVQRVPDTETCGRIHTSTCTVAVLPEATKVDFKIDDKDLRIDVYRAGGAGGQHVNKTESAVRITHLPTGMVVVCQDERSQIQNRARAMLVLQSKLADYYQTQADAQYADKRKNQVGTGDRSERIRTYNFPQDRVTDHRIKFSVSNLPSVMEGNIGAIVHALDLNNAN